MLPSFCSDSSDDDCVEITFEQFYGYPRDRTSVNVNTNNASQSATRCATNRFHGHVFENFTYCRDPCCVQCPAAVNLKERVADDSGVPHSDDLDFEQEQHYNVTNTRSLYDMSALQHALPQIDETRRRRRKKFKPEYGKVKLLQRKPMFGIVKLDKIPNKTKIVYDLVSDTDSDTDLVENPWPKLPTKNLNCQNIPVHCETDKQVNAKRRPSALFPIPDFSNNMNAVMHSVSPRCVNRNELGECIPREKATGFISRKSRPHRGAQIKMDVKRSSPACSPVSNFPNENAIMQKVSPRLARHAEIVTKVNVSPKRNVQESVGIETEDAIECTFIPDLSEIDHALLPMQTSESDDDVSMEVSEDFAPKAAASETVFSSTAKNTRASESSGDRSTLSDVQDRGSSTQWGPQTKQKIGTKEHPYISLSAHQKVAMNKMNPTPKHALVVSNRKAHPPMVPSHIVSC